MHGEIAKELGEKINEGKGCIILDIGCSYNPYIEAVLDKMKLRSVSLADKLNLRLFISGKEMMDCKLNHRYRNKSYTTISKRNTSKLGYPCYVEPEDFTKQISVQLKIEFVHKGGKIRDSTSITVPVQLNLDAKHPICMMRFYYQFREKDLLYIYSWENDRDGGIYRHLWTNDRTLKHPSYLECLQEGGDNTFEKAITPSAFTLDRLSIDGDGMMEILPETKANN